MQISRWVRTAMAAGFAASVALVAPQGGALAAPGQEPAPPPPGDELAVTAEPSTGLVDYQIVQLTGTGFEPGGLYEIFECRADAVDESGCDPDNAYDWDADDNGVVQFSFPVDARIFDMTGRETDCRSAPGTCKIGIGFLSDFSLSAFATVDFDPDSPLAPLPTLSVEPDTGLRDGQTVTVEGANLSSLFETFVYQCAADRPRSSTTCNFDQDVRAVADEDGMISVEYDVAAAFVPAAGGAPIDCTARQACVIEMAQGFSNSPDRFARAPLRFRAQPKPPSPTTSEPTTPPPAPPPATPVPGSPQLTG